jgi:hypothetical protein
MLEVTRHLPHSARLRYLIVLSSDPPFREESARPRLRSPVLADAFIHRRQPIDVIVQAEVQIEGVEIQVVGKGQQR